MQQHSQSCLIMNAENMHKSCMKSLTHLCDAGSRQHAGNARDKALLAGGVEAAEALARLLEVVLLQGTEHA